MTWEGAVHKCPGCGEAIPSFTDKCPVCGHEFRDVGALSSAKELSERLDAIESSRPKNKKGRVKKSNNREIDAVDEQKINLIRNFPIPNTREDLIEFLILALSNYDVSLDEYGDEDGAESEKALSDAWKAKLDQAFNKSEVLFGDDPAFDRFRKMREQKFDEIKEKKAAGKKNMTKLWIGIAAIWVFAIAFCIVVFAFDAAAIQRENDRLQGIVEEVYELVDDGNYPLARAKASEIVFSGSTTQAGNQAAEKWDTVRQETMSMIDAVEGRG